MNIGLAMLCARFTAMHSLDVVLDSLRERVAAVVVIVIVAVDFLFVCSNNAICSLARMFVCSFIRSFIVGIVVDRLLLLHNKHTKSK